MEQEKHNDSHQKDFFEDFMILRDSDYWPYLLLKTQEDIISLLDEHQYLGGENK